METERRHPRYKRRLTVKVGDQTTTHSCFTNDISLGGVFIKTNMVYRPGTTVKIEFIDQPCSWFADGVVAWAKQVPPLMVYIERCGMGIRFLNPSSGLLSWIRSNSRMEKLGETTGVTPLTLLVPSPAELKRELDQNIRNGGLFIPTSDPPPKDAEVEVELVLSFSGKKIHATGLVVMVNQNAPMQGVGVQLTQLAKLIQEIESTLTS